MSKGRIPSTGRKARRPTQLKKVGKKVASSQELLAPAGPHCGRYAGISLSGGKADRACVAILEHYPEQKKLFLSKLIEKIKTEEFISADLKIHEILLQYQDSLKAVAFDVPLSLPKCVRCQAPCPGYEACQETEIKFIRDLYQADEGKRKPKKMFTPYTQRCVDAHLASQFGDFVDVQPALGSNLAPLTARALFIKRRLNFPIYEVSPRISVWQFGLQLKINRTYLKVYRNSVGGEEARRVILHALADKWGVFFYQQDFKNMTENLHSFEALISAITAHQALQGKTFERPAHFPADEQWVEVPL